MKNHENGESFTIKPGESKDLNWPVPDASSQHYLEEGHFLEFRFRCTYGIVNYGIIESTESLPPGGYGGRGVWYNPPLLTQILVFRNDYEKVLQHVNRYDSEISDQIAEGDFNQGPPGGIPLTDRPYGGKNFLLTGTNGSAQAKAGSNTSYEFEVHTEPPPNTGNFKNKFTFRYV